MRQTYERIRSLPQGRWLLPAFLCVSLLFLFFVFSGDRDYKRDISIRKANSYIEGLRIVTKKDGADAWILTARRADFTKDETLARMDSVSMDIKKEGVVVDAENGTYNMENKDLTLENNVTIRAKGSLIRTKSLEWNPSRGALTSNSSIRIESPRFAVEGEGLSATEDNKVTLMRNVRATFF